MIASTLCLLALLTPADWQTADLSWTRAQPADCGGGDCVQTVSVLNGRIELIWSGYEDAWLAVIRGGRLTPEGARRLSALKALPKLPTVERKNVRWVILRRRQDSQMATVEYPDARIPPAVAQMDADMRILEQVMRGCAPHRWVIPDCAPTPKASTR